MRNSPNIEIVETVANKIDNYFVYDKDLSENDPEHNATSPYKYSKFNQT